MDGTNVASGVVRTTDDGTRTLSGVPEESRLLGSPVAEFFGRRARHACTGTWTVLRADEVQSMRNMRQKRTPADVHGS